MFLKLKNFVDIKIIEIIEAALSSVDPYLIVKQKLCFEGNLLTIGNQQIQLNKRGNFYIIGIGKAVLPMALAATEVLGDNISGGVLVSKHHNETFQHKLHNKLRIVIGSHPVPTDQSVNAARAIVNCLSSTIKNDLVLGLISGGGSALVTLPREPLEIGHINQLSQALIESGATINEINSVRKHLDMIKGGGLLDFIYPAGSINMILSDVIGDDLSVIASGPTSADPTTFGHALSILEKYHLNNKIDKRIIHLLRKGSNGEIKETLKEDDYPRTQTTNIIIGSLSIAAQSAKEKAEGFGYHVELYDLKLQGEACETGRTLANHLINRSREINTSEKPLCIIAGGETTVTVRGQGKGGRNQEIALSAAISLAGKEKLLFITLATDGEDGPTDAAGAVVDGNTLQRALQLGLDAKSYLEQNDSYHFLEKTGSLIRTGPTGTNVNDLVFMFAF